jgi:GWxTD domain-containing protein
MRLHATALLAVTLSAASLFAADLDRYKDWDRSPQGYFLTTAESAQWSAIRTDAEAEKFVADFVAKRGGEKFTKEVALRAQNADKYLSIGKVKGSETLRGKVVILFGPPSGMQVNDRKGRDGYVSSPSSAAVSDLGTSASASSSGRGGGDSQTMNAAGTSGVAFKDFTFSFSAKAVPALGTDYDVTIEADAGSGKDRIRDKKKAAELDEKFEAVAKASIKQ